MQSFALPLALVALLAIGSPIRAAFRRVRIPPAVSLLALGVVVGPAGLDVLPSAWSSHRTSLSAAAFVVLLLRAGLGLAPSTLRAIAIPAGRLGTVPVAVEAGVVTILARAFLFDDWRLSALAGFLVAAVSPAVILPAMLALKDDGRGGPRHVPDLVIGQTIVNAVLAPAAIGFVLQALVAAPGSPQVGAGILTWPLSVVAGAALGFGGATVLRLERLVPSHASPARTRLAVAVLLVAGSAAYFGVGEGPWVNGVVATLALAASLRRRLGRDDVPLRDTLRTVWDVAEIVLFVNLGSAVRLDALANAPLALAAIVLIGAALIVRLGTAAAILVRSPLEPAERRFVTTAHVPKATIQAVFGAVPLLTFREVRPDLVAAGESLLVLAVLAIVTTAPLGALLLERYSSNSTVSNIFGPPRSVRWTGQRVRVVHAPSDPSRSS